MSVAVLVLMWLAAGVVGLAEQASASAQARRRWEQAGSAPSEAPVVFRSASETRPGTDVPSGQANAREGDR